MAISLALPITTLQPISHAMGEQAQPRLPASGQRILSALKWNVSGEVVGQAIRFAFGIALARLLSPCDFGLMAMLMVLIQVVISNADLGLEDALIQKREITEVHRSSVFWILMLAGGVLAAAQIAVAPWIARLYGVDELRDLAFGLSAVFLLRGIGTVPRAMIARQLDFRATTSRWCAAVTLGGTCAVILAWYGFGVVSLAVEIVVSTATESVLLWSASRWRPRLEVSSAALRELFGFSAYRPATRALNYWAQRIDQLLVGKLLGSSVLGLYARAFNVTRFPVMSVARVILDVMFPSLAGIQGDAARMRSIYVRATGAVALACVPIAMGLSATAEPFVLVVLGPQWKGAIPILRILSLAALFESLIVFTTSLYLAHGRADLVLRLTVAQRALSIGAVVLALRWGALGVATAQLLCAVVNVLPMLYFAGTLVDLPIGTVLTQLSRVFLAGAVMMVLVVALGAWATPRLGMLGTLGLEVLVGIVAYWAALHLLRVGAYRDLTEVVLGRAPAGQEPTPRLG